MELYNIFFRCIHLFTVCFLSPILYAVNQGLAFDIEDTGSYGDNARQVFPWKEVVLDKEYGGQWIVCGDVNADGQVEIISVENYNENDVHYTSAVVAQDLNGKVLWRWGNPDIGRKAWHHDVACQIHDWDGDDQAEVVLCTQGAIVELDGKMGNEKRRIEIARDATDCLVFCDLKGIGRASDVLVKDRYHRIWAFDQQGKFLWSVTNPGGYRTAHQPRPVDIDSEGKDEIMAGYSLLNSDGSIRWTYKSNSVNQNRGHLDCMRIFRKAQNPEKTRLVLTCCGANNLAMIDGTGKVLWEISGHHFESIDIGPVLSNISSPQIVVDVDHQPFGNSPIWIVDENGLRRAKITTDYSRHHALVDWTGDGLCEILVAHNRAIYDHQGKRIATLITPLPADQETEKHESSLLIGDMDADLVPDIMIATPQILYIFRNEHGRPIKDLTPGTESNFTLY
ncbi:MAG: hypothetical protein JXA82_06350 [Sedimentisphaerales bacterium]|nr:hypothetical protein [Sedimentisphaerales bacterium]